MASRANAVVKLRRVVTSLPGLSLITRSIGFSFGGVEKGGGGISVKCWVSSVSLHDASLLVLVLVLQEAFLLKLLEFLGVNCGGGDRKSLS